MAKLIKILAASMGGGLVLGAGIRLGEAIAAQRPATDSEASQKLAERLGELETRLRSMETGRLETKGPAASAYPASLTPESVMRSELQGWLEDSIAARLSEVEARLKTESDRGQKQMLDAFAEGVEARVIHRISRLEEEVAGQSAAMSELRECSLRTERSMQKLLGSLDRLIPRNPSDPAETAGEQTHPPGQVQPEPPQSKQVQPESDPPPAVEPPASATPATPKRWHIFG